MERQTVDGLQGVCRGGAGSLVFPEPVWVEPDEPGGEAVLGEATGGFLFPLVARLLYRRGCRTAADVRRMLRPDAGHGTEPNRIAGVPEVAERLVLRVREGACIGVYGDFDADGVCTTALYVRALRRLGIPVVWTVSRRGSDGHGIGPAGVDRLSLQGAEVLLSGDTGASSGTGVRYALGVGLEVLVTDHHPADGSLPDGVLMANPHGGLPSEGRALCGVGVAYQVLREVYDRLGRGEEELSDLLDLVALGTVADVVPLDDPDNRRWVRGGLARIRQGLGTPGVGALCELSRDPRVFLTERELGREIAPMVNSPGRLDVADGAVRLFLSDVWDEVLSLREDLVRWNVERRLHSDRVYREAGDMILRGGTGSDRGAWVLASEGWHSGVVGIAAGRLAQDLGRPVLLLGRHPQTGSWGGSGRAGTENLHLREILEECSSYLRSFGGHPGAVGFGLRSYDLSTFAGFADAVEEAVLRRLSPEVRGRKLEPDVEVRFGELTRDVFDQLQRLAPFGAKNREPLFLARGVRVKECRTVGGGAHRRLDLEQGGVVCSGIAFGLGDSAPWVGSGVDLDVVFLWQVNRWKGQETLQIKVEGVRRAVG